MHAFRELTCKSLSSTRTTCFFLPERPQEIPLYHIRGFNVVSLGLTFVPQIVSTYLCYDTSNKSQNAAVYYHQTIFFFFSCSMKMKSKTCNFPNHHWREPPAASQASFH